MSCSCCLNDVYEFGKAPVCGNFEGTLEEEFIYQEVPPCDTTCEDTGTVAMLCISNYGANPFRIKIVDGAGDEEFIRIEPGQSTTFKLSNICTLSLVTVAAGSNPICAGWKGTIVSKVC